MCLFGRGDIRTRTMVLELLASFLSVHTSGESSVHKIEQVMISQVFLFKKIIPIDAKKEDLIRKCKF